MALTILRKAQIADVVHKTIGIVLSLVLGLPLWVVARVGDLAKWCDDQLYFGMQRFRVKLEDLTGVTELSELRKDISRLSEVITMDVSALAAPSFSQELRQSAKTRIEKNVPDLRVALARLRSLNVGSDVTRWTNRGEAALEKVANIGL
jgi:ribosomal protein L29